jgi:hypothetical protein
MGENTMFNGIELILGVACSLMGIAGGYLLLIAVFAGIQSISKYRGLKSKVGKNLDT